MTARDLRLNNPLNLEKTPPGGQRWQGEVDSVDARFAQFDTMANGFRAGAINVIHAQTWHNCDTVLKLISRWAPAPENDPAAYAERVVHLQPVGVNDKVDLLDLARLEPTVAAMTCVESGLHTEQFIDLGLPAALHDGCLDAVAHCRAEARR